MHFVMVTPMAKRVKIETAGPLTRISCYTMQLPQDTGKTRAEKRKLSTAARTKMNAKTSWNKCRLTMSANFGIGDLFVTLTYTDKKLPKERGAAVVQLRRWLDKMRGEYRRRGIPLRYIYTTENAHGDGRYHHHLVMGRIDKAVELLQSMWDCGYVDIRYIDNLDFTPLAKYFTKECNDKGRKLGQQTWTPSRGLIKPEARTVYVPDNYSPVTPVGSLLIENPSFRNAYGEYAYLEYLTPEKKQNKDAEEMDLCRLHEDVS